MSIFPIFSRFFASLPRVRASRSFLAVAALAAVAIPDVASAVAHLERYQVPVAPVLSVAETVHHPHHRQRGTVRTVHDPLHGDFDMPGMPLKFSRFPQDLPLQAATLGQHNEEILTTHLGRSAEDVQRLRAEGVVIEKIL